MGSKKSSLIIYFVFFYALLFWGTGFGGLFTEGSSYSFRPAMIGILTGLTVGIIAAVIAVRMRDRIILKAARATRVSPSAYPELIDTVNEYARTCKIPIPDLYLTPEMPPNFCVIGSKSDNLKIIFTRGFLDLRRVEYCKAAIAWAATADRKGFVRSRSLSSSLAYVFMFPAKIGDFFTFGSASRYNIVNLILLLPLAPLASILIHLTGGKRDIYEVDQATTDLTGDQGYLGVTFIEMEKKLSSFMVDTDLCLMPLFVVPPRSSNVYYSLFRPFPPIQKRIKRLSMSRKKERSR